MTGNIGHFETLSTYHKNVIVGSSQELPVEAKGIVILKCLLSNGSVNAVHLKNVVFIPSLYFNLFSWNLVHNMLDCSSVDNGFVLKNKNGSVVISVEFVGNNSYVIESTKYALISLSEKPYTFWYEAFEYQLAKVF